MGNALGQLFTDIAASIRGGLGDIEKMKPNSFPDKINEIVALIGSGDGDGKNLVSKQGSFTGANEPMTITHGMDTMPDFIIVYMGDINDSVDIETESPLAVSCGFRSGFDIQFKTILTFFQGSLRSSTHTLDSMSSTAKELGYVHCPDETTFRVGGLASNVNGKLAPSTTYYWTAIWGLGGDVVQNVVDAVIQPLTITENGTYVPPEGVNGYSPVTVNVPDPTKIVILSEQTISGFAMDSDFGAYSPGFVTPAQYVLKAGETYFVDWDGKQYECTAVSFDFSGMEMIFIGNGTSFGYPGNGEPFAMAYNASLDNSQIFSTDTAESHTVGIWQRVSAGSSADLRYVTFMNDDGTVELGKKAVATGDDCADPIARGIFPTPTKESSAQYNYTFYGWATEPGGGANANWNKAVTENRKVYANFTSTVRYYTITYYDDNGTTVLKTERLAYGAMPSYSPTKGDYMVDRWEPALSQVTGNVSYTAVWKEKPTFETATWAEIAEVISAGQASERYAVGDIKEIVLTDSATPLVVEIVGFNHDDLADGSGKAAISIMVKIPRAGTDKYTAGDKKNWLEGALRTKVQSYYNKLPDDLKPLIKTVKKLTMLGAKQSDYSATESSETLWLPGYRELNKKYSADYYTDGNAYQLYANDFNLTQKMDSNGTAIEYFLRSTRSAWNNYYFDHTTTNGTHEPAMSRPNSYAAYIVFGFCI